MEETNNTQIWSVYILTCIIWGSTWLAIRISLESLTPLFSSGLRFLFASVFIIILLKIKSIKSGLPGVKIQNDKTSIKLYILMTLFSFSIPYALVYWAEQFIPSGLAAVLFGAYPFFIAIFSYFMISHETIDLYKILGIILGFAGIVIIFYEGTGYDFSSYLLGMAALVLSAMFQAFNAVIVKKYGYHLNPLSMNFYPMLFAGIILMLTAFIFEDISKQVFDLPAAASVFYLALFGSLITFTSYYWLLKKVNIVILSLIAFITPVIALILGYFAYNEELSLRDFLGSLLVLFGLLSANIGSFRKVSYVKKTL